MDDKTQLLDRYYDAFIKEDAPRAFFLGLADYLEFLDSIPEFDQITEEIQKSVSPLEDEYQRLSKKSILSLGKIKNGLLNYVKKSKIKNEGIDRATRDYEWLLEGRIVSSMSKPQFLHWQLRDIIEILYNSSKHKKIVLKYVKLLKGQESLVENYLYDKATFNFFDFEADMKRKAKTELWGQLHEIARLNEAVKKGREKHKELVEKMKKEDSTKATSDVLNYSLLIGEWVKVEEKSASRLVFFKPEKIRPFVSRLHRYVLSQYLLGEKMDKKLVEKEVETSTKFKPELKTERGVGYFKFHKQGKKIKVGSQKTRKYRLLRCLLDPFGVAKTVDVVFEAIENDKDSEDGNLQDAYTANQRESEIIKHTLKELQKIDGLRGKISLDFHNSNRSVRLVLKD